MFPHPSPACNSFATSRRSPDVFQINIVALPCLSAGSTEKNLLAAFPRAGAKATTGGRATWKKFRQRFDERASVLVARQNRSGNQSFSTIASSIAGSGGPEFPMKSCGQQLTRLKPTDKPTKAGFSKYSMATREAGRERCFDIIENLHSRPDSTTSPAFFTQIRRICARCQSPRDNHVAMRRCRR